MAKVWSARNSSSIWSTTSGENRKIKHKIWHLTNSPEMSPWKLHLIIYTLMVAVTFKAVSLHTNTLSESEFAMLKTFLELLYWTALQDCSHMSRNVSNDWKSVTPQSSLRFGNSQNLHEVKSDGYGGWSTFNIEFWPNVKHVTCGGTDMMQDPTPIFSKHQLHKPLFISAEFHSCFCLTLQNLDVNALVQ